MFLPIITSTLAFTEGVSGYSGLIRRFSASLTVSSPQRGLVRSSTEHRRGEDEDDLPVPHSHRLVVTFLYSVVFHVAPLNPGFHLFKGQLNGVNEKGWVQGCDY